MMLPDRLEVGVKDIPRARQWKDRLDGVRGREGRG